MKFYDLRHAHASLLVDRIGQPGALTLKEVQERLGHSSAVMTLDRYAHAGQQDHDKTRNALDAALGLGDDCGDVVPIRRKGHDRLTGGHADTREVRGVVAPQERSHR
jgi:hypothetical protein